MSLTTNWMETLDGLVVSAITAGAVKGALSGPPERVIESGLAHIFFYGDTVYKLYKTHADKDHFIKGVLAPTVHRQQFITHDFKLNQHFSDDVYRQLHSVYYRNGEVTVAPFAEDSLYSLVEMSRLTFESNLHELLLRGEVTATQLYRLGQETARAIDTCPITAPEDVNWYDLASERVDFLERFVDWLPAEYGAPIRSLQIIDALRAHLATHQTEYRDISGRQLSVNLDNHDENVFFIADRPQFIDLLPPMRCWWFGVPHANLSNLMANVSALYSPEAAAEVQRGYQAYFKEAALPAHSFGFTNAFAHLISIAHFGTVPGKHEVTTRYLMHLEEIPGWLEG